MKFSALKSLLKSIGTSARTFQPRGPDVRDTLTKEIVRAYRRSLISLGNRAKQSVAERLNSRRFARRKASDLNRKIRTGKRPPIALSDLLERYSRSPLLDAVLPNRKTLWRLAPKRVSGPRMELSLKDFSFIEHPAETMQKLHDIARIEATAPSALLHFDDTYCRDISPYLVLAEIWPNMAAVFQGGRMPVPIQKVLTAVNLHRLMNMRLDGAKDVEDVWAFPLKQRRVNKRAQRIHPDLGPQRKEEVADQFGDALDTWLGECGDMELTESGRAWFSTIITELLDNAERHSDMTDEDALTGNWSCAAFMARRLEDDKWVYRCHMGFLSVGTTVGESLMSAPEETLQDIAAYQSLHREEGFSDENLITIYALQDGVTRVHEAAEEDRGGIGFQEVLKFLRILAHSHSPDADPKLTMVSGNTCIQLRDPYLEGVSSGLNEPRVVWFNPQNDPTLPPDANHVFSIEHRFAGTIVGISFALDPEYLRANVHDPDQPSRPDE